MSYWNECAFSTFRCSHSWQWPKMENCLCVVWISQSNHLWRTLVGSLSTEGERVSMSWNMKLVRTGGRWGSGRCLVPSTDKFDWIGRGKGAVSPSALFLSLVTCILKSCFSPQAHFLPFPLRTEISTAPLLIHELILTATFGPRNGLTYCHVHEVSDCCHAHAA